MNNKQKIFLFTVSLITLIFVSTIIFSTSSPKNEKISIIATFYPLAFLSQEIGGDYVQITQLVPINTEIHSWEPSSAHILAAENADVIVYNGAGLDVWMENDVIPVLSNSSKNRVVVDSTDNLDLLVVDEHHEDELEENHNHGAYDPHTWVSPYMAKLQAEKIYNALIQVDPQHESYYTQRWENLEVELTELDINYSTTLSTALKERIFVSHEAFGYLAHRYNFEQHGVIGLSADQQPSATSIANLVNEMETDETYFLYVDPVYSIEYAQTIKNEVQIQTGHDVTILELYLMLGPYEELNFLEQMEVNLNNLKIGLKTD